MVWALFVVMPLHRQRLDWYSLAAAALAFRPWLAAEHVLLLTVPLGMAVLGAPRLAALALVLAAAVAIAGRVGGASDAAAAMQLVPQHGI